MNGDDEQIEDVQPEKPTYDQLVARLTIAEREAERWQRYYQEAEQGRINGAVKLKDAQEKADYAREALNLLKLDYAELKQQFDRAQGWIERARETEMPPERRMQDRRERNRQQYPMEPYGHKTPWHSM